VQGHQLAGVSAEQYAGDTVAGKIGAHFPESLPHRAAKWHANRPAPLRPDQVASNRLALARRKTRFDTLVVK